MENKKRITDPDEVAAYRIDIALYAIRCNNYRATAREYKVNRRMVRTWAIMYLEVNDKPRDEQIAYFRNKSRLGQKHPLRITDEERQAIVMFRLLSGLGARLIKECLELPYSDRAIHKVLVQAELVEKPKTKTRKKRDMSEMRAAIPTMHKIQVDIKYLTDIATIYPDIVLNHIPKYQLTARDYKSGFTLICFSHTKDSTSIAIFVRYVIDCLKDAGIDISKIHFQSDNGSEFRYMGKKDRLSLYEEICASEHIEYRYIPPASPTFNSDVESFHNRIECEFYNIERFFNEDDLLAKAWCYMMWYNRSRKNRGKDNKSPLTILTENDHQNLDKLTTYPPIIVDRYVKDLELIKKGGYFHTYISTYPLKCVDTKTEDINLSPKSGYFKCSPPTQYLFPA